MQRGFSIYIIRTSGALMAVGKLTVKDIQKGRMFNPDEVPHVGAKVSRESAVAASLHKVGAIKIVVKVGRYKSRRVSRLNLC